MTKAVLNAISGVDLYATLSLGLFMTFFIAMLVWVCSLRKHHIQHMIHLPLETSQETGETHHV